MDLNDAICLNLENRIWKKANKNSMIFHASYLKILSHTLQCGNGMDQTF